MTLLEVMVATVVLTIAVYLLSSTIAATVGHATAKREMATAMVAARSQIELLRGQSFRQVFALFNHDPSDDPAGAGTAPGPNFEVPGLSPRNDDLDGMVGEVRFSHKGPDLRENAVAPELDMPRDLNGDLYIDQRNHADDHIVLPVEVRIRWNGRAGEREFKLFTMLSALEKLGGAP